MVANVGTAATNILLRDPSPEPLLAARALWDKHSGAPGLLDGRGYRYNPETNRYTRANGTRVSDAQLRGYVRRVTAETEREMKKNTQQLIAGGIMLAVWYSRMRDLMAALYRTVFVLSIGGWAFEDDTQRNLFYLWTLLQFQRVDNFYLQLQAGTQALNGQAMNRAGMYADWGNSFHQNLLLEQAIQGGRKEGKRVLGENEDHCHDDGERQGCVELAEMGWLPIAQVVPLGDAVCYCITSPESRVLTSTGWRSLNDVRIGDYVLTHKMRFRKVLAKMVKPSQPYHRQVFIQGSTGEWIGATDNHLWFTEDGWKDANYIYISNSMVYNMGIETESNHASTLSEMWKNITRQDQQDQRRLLSWVPASIAMPMWKEERSTSDTMQSLRQSRFGERAVGQARCACPDVEGDESRRSKQALFLRELELEYRLAQEGRRPVLRSLLGRRPEAMDLPLSMELDQAQRKNTAWIPHSSQKLESGGRSPGESGNDQSAQSWIIACKNQSADAKGSGQMEDNYLSELWSRAAGTYPQRQAANILFGDMPVGTPLYDITVEEDHSFCLEGLFAHNSRCHCRIIYR